MKIAVNAKKNYMYAPTVRIMYRPREKKMQKIISNKEIKFSKAIVSLSLSDSLSVYLSGCLCVPFSNVPAVAR